MTDARTRHPGHTPTDPPVKRVMGAPIIKSKVSEQSLQLWQLAGKWSPAGIVAALIILFLALGGASGVKDLASSITAASSASLKMQAELEQMRKDIKTSNEQTREQITAWQASHMSIQRVNTVQDEQILFIRELANELNQGPPHESWATKDSRGIKWEPPPPSGDRVPINITAAIFPTHAAE